MHHVLELDLFKEVSAHYERFYSFQPLTAKIYALMVLNNCSEGLTFDDFLETFHSSKSSISHSLNTLVEMNFIEQFKKENERRRYFRINRSLFLMRLEDVHKRLTQEMEINLKLRGYRKAKCSELFREDEFDFYISHLSLATQSIEKTIQKLKLYINTNEKSH